MWTTGVEWVLTQIQIASSGSTFSINSPTTAEGLPHRIHRWHLKDAHLGWSDGRDATDMENAVPWIFGVGFDNGFDNHRLFDSYLVYVFFFVVLIAIISVFYGFFLGIEFSKTSELDSQKKPYKTFPEFAVCEVLLCCDCWPRSSFQRLGKAHRQGVRGTQVIRGFRVWTHFLGRICITHLWIIG